MYNPRFPSDSHIVMVGVVANWTQNVVYSNLTRFFVYIHKEQTYRC